MTFTEFKNCVISAINETKIEQYELYYETSSDESVSAFNNEVNQYTGSTSGGICLRLVYNNHMGYASTEELSAESASELVMRAIDNASVLESDDPVFLGQAGQKYEDLHLNPEALPSTEQLKKLALDSNKIMLESDPSVTPNSEMRAISFKMSMDIVNSNGLNLHYDNQATALLAIAVVSDGKEYNNSYEMKIGGYSQLKPEEVIHKAVNTAKEELGGEVPSTGVFPVIFSPDAMSDLLATYSSVFSSESAQKGLSLLNGKEGEIIAADSVTLYDDPFYKDNSFPINFDAEGTPTSKKALIQNGKLETLLYNLTTAAKAGKNSTGNASKGNYSSPVDIRPFTMYMAPGNLTKEELFAKAGNGILINSLGGLHAGANVISGDFSLQSSGFLIENGQKTRPIKAFTIAGNFYEMLKKIVSLSDTVEMSGSTGSTAFASPYVLVDQMSIAGK